MAQFDFLIILPLLFALLVTLTFYYKINLTVSVPNFFGVKKFRRKKLSSVYFYKVFYSNKEINKNNTYKNLFLKK